MDFIEEDMDDVSGDNVWVKKMRPSNVGDYCSSILLCAGISQAWDFSGISSCSNNKRHHFREINWDRPSNYDLHYLHCGVIIGEDSSARSNESVYLGGFPDDDIR